MANRQGRRSKVLGPCYIDLPFQPETLKEISYSCSCDDPLSFCHCRRLVPCSLSCFSQDETEPSRATYECSSSLEKRLLKLSSGGDGTAVPANTADLAETDTVEISTSVSASNVESYNRSVHGDVDAGEKIRHVDVPC